eukprot:4572859-Prymnesium_polylepis.3
MFPRVAALLATPTATWPCRAARMPPACTSTAPPEPWAAIALTRSSSCPTIPCSCLSSRRVQTEKSRRSMSR